jgi:hypothetical protein
MTAFEPIPINCHCANQCPQLANAFRTRTEQECALKVAFGTFANSSTNARSLRIADMRRERLNVVDRRQAEWGAGLEVFEEKSS